MKSHYSYHSFDAWLKSIHGKKVQKIPLDANAGCPNRDGTIAHTGCSFCNAQGSGSGLMNKGLNLREQWQFWLEKYANSVRHKNTQAFLAYMQSFSNTYGSAQRLENITNELIDLPNIAGLAIGTRPDCVDAEKIEILSRLPWNNTWIEYGVQSMHDRTLKRIYRGHSVQSSIDAIHLAHDYGLKVCVHLMAGLPGESREDFLETVQKVCTLPIDGIKMHGLYVCKGTPIAKDYAEGQYTPLLRDPYMDMIVEALCYIPSSIIIHRLTADPGSDELIAPEWVREKGSVILGIEEILYHQSLWQGCRADVTESNPYNKKQGIPCF